MTRELRVPIVVQDNANLLPFTFMGEAGTEKDLGDGSKLNFIVETVEASILDYASIVVVDNEILNS